MKLSAVLFLIFFSTVSSIAKSNDSTIIVYDTVQVKAMSELDYYKKLYEKESESRKSEYNIILIFIAIIVGLLIVLISIPAFFNWQLNKKKLDEITTETEKKINVLDLKIKTYENELETNTQKLQINRVINLYCMGNLLEHNSTYKSLYNYIESLITLYELDYEPHKDEYLLVSRKVNDVLNKIHRNLNSDGAKTPVDKKVKGFIELAMNTMKNKKDKGETVKEYDKKSIKIINNFDFVEQEKANGYFLSLKEITK
jgi:hypothetical protein